MKENRILVILTKLIGIWLIVPLHLLAQNKEVKQGFAPLNGLDLYYEIHGSGEPLILLHGGLGSTGMFPPSHIVRFYELLGGGQRDGGWDGSGRSQSHLAILPGLTHYNIFMSPMLASAVHTFLNTSTYGLDE
jgi:pimeloyl-ACP methyl ester carboxylesterase